MHIVIVSCKQDYISQKRFMKYVRRTVRISYILFSTMMLLLRGNIQQFANDFQHNLKLKTTYEFFHLEIFYVMCD